MRFKKSYGLLFILLLTPLVLVGVVQSVAPPTIYVNQSSYGITVYGNNWAPYTDVTIYYDVEDADHMIAVVTANYGGYFQTNIPTDYIPMVGAHTVIAVQGADKATAVYNVGIVAPPDDRLLNPILSIKTKLNDVDLEVKAIEAKLDPGGGFYNFVNAWFGTVDSKLTSIENKIDNSQATQILAYYKGEYNPPGVLPSMTLVPGTQITTNLPVKFTVTLVMYFLTGDLIEVWSDTVGAGTLIDIEHYDEDTADVFGTQRDSFTFAGNSMVITAGSGSDSVLLHWKVLIEGAPGTVVNVLNPP